MKGSVKIARIFGIPVRVHWSFLLIVVFVIYTGKKNHMSWHSIGLFGLLVFAMFICVILHEFGHALSARYYGIKTQDITILPIGGVARLDKLPDNPIHELVVAIAGPAVNMIIFALIGLVIYIFYGFRIDLGDAVLGRLIDKVDSHQLWFLTSLMYSNAFLVYFNMIPAFPMDGGRVLRALLSTQVGRTKATRIAAIVGQIIAVGMFAFGLWEGQYVLAGISVFIFYTARSEYNYVKLDETLSYQTVANILRTEYTSLQTNDYMQTAASTLRKGGENNFLVFDGEGSLKGVLYEGDILDAEKYNQYDAIVSTYSHTDFLCISSSESIKAVYSKMLQTGQDLMPVMDNERLLGVVDHDMIHRFIERHS